MTAAATGSLVAMLPRNADHLVYIPTNRDASASIASTADEVASLDQRTQSSTVLVVVDGSHTSVTKTNRVAADAAVDRTGIRVVFLDEPGWRHFRRTVCEGLPDSSRSRAESLLRFEYPNYGAGPIKAALLACATGARTLHRRDSDQTVADPSAVAPLAVELRWLGKDFPPEPTNVAPQRVLAVGSSLLGQPARDRRDLDSVDPSFGGRLDRAHGSTGTRRSATRSVTYDADGTAVNMDASGEVEMGICALADVFTWIPEMPAASIFGVDYMQKNLVYQVGAAVLHHDRRATHEYDARRAAQSSKEAVRDYTLAELRYACIRPVWNAANRSIRQLDLLHLEPQDRVSAYVNAWREHLPTLAERSQSIKHEYVSIYHQAIAAASDASVRERLTWRLDAIEISGNAAAAESRAAIEQFLDLAELWPALGRRAREAHRGS